MVAQDHEILQAFKATLNFLCLLWLEEPAVDSRRMQRQDTRIIRMAILAILDPSWSILELTHAASAKKSQDDP